MNFSNHRMRFPYLSTIALLLGAFSLLPAALETTAQEAEAPGAVIAEQLFASPDEAVKALQAATAAGDKTALHKIFGPQVQGLLTGDDVQDANNAQRFATAMAQGCNPVKDGEDKITLEVGTNDWPMPIPLVKANGQWYFDTAAGEDEIINRHIGKDELHAIGVCRAYVVAQKQYADMIPKVGGGAKYALHFKSTPGTRDGLYWEAMDGEPASPFGPLVAQAHVQGFGRKMGTGVHPFHGYYFKILTGQGPAATGGEMSYLSGGVLAGGFALVAYPQQWDKSGIMAFIVNQDGKVYQSNLGEDTSRIAAAMTEYNPDSKWTLTQDEGVQSAVSEK